MRDPALRIDTVPETTKSYKDAPKDTSAVYVIDFDGVFADGIEDAIYKLEEMPNEAQQLKVRAKELGLRCEGMDVRYQRHLIFQEAAFRNGLEIVPGPGFSLAKWALENARAFVITARSGWSATARMREFLSANTHPPLELYQVKRTQKSLQISLLCDEFSSKNIFYIEDSPTHLVQAENLELPNLTTFFCKASICLREAESLYRRTVWSNV